MKDVIARIDTAQLEAELARIKFMEPSITSAHTILSIVFMAIKHSDGCGCLELDVLGAAKRVLERVEQIIEQQQAAAAATPAGAEDSKEREAAERAENWPGRDHGQLTNQAAAPAERGE